MRFFKAVLIAAVFVTTPVIATAQQGPMPVEVASPLKATIVDWDEYTGRFEAVRRVELRARVSGYLQATLFRDGQIVEANDVLYRIDPRPFEAEYARAQAELAAAQAEQQRAEVELRRGRELVRSRTVSETTLDERVATKLRADAEVQIAEASLRSAGLNLEYTEIKAPFTGRISNSRVSVGNLVSQAETVLATVVSINPMRLTFTASEADYLKYVRLSLRGDRPSSREKANDVQAKLIDETEWIHQGKMDFVNNEIDEGSGTITGRALFDNPDGIFTPGLFARLRLVGSGEYEALLIPDAAILSDQARKIVMVVDVEGIVSPRVVQPGPLYRGLRVIREGLTAEDKVVVAGIQRARPGGQVALQEAEIAFPDAIN
ncbi:MAG: efflux RND transporter periplasmic adaptor subunit [Pseudomonadota bacterium]